MFKRITIAIIASLGFLAGSAYAAPDGMSRYSGVALGQVGVKAGSFDESDTGYKFFGGLMFNKNFGVELAYMDGASPRGSASIGRAQYEISPMAFTFEGIASIPLGKSFAAFGKVGIAFYDVYIQNLGSDSGNDIIYGAGFSLGLGKKFELRAEWEQFGFDFANGSGDISMYSLGGVFKF